VGDPSAKVKRPVKELKEYEKVCLQFAENKHVTVSLDRRALAYWNVAANNWKVDPGKFVVSVGDSSENTPLTKDFTVR
jgi:beta-glucosidase